MVAELSHLEIPWKLTSVTYWKRANWNSTHLKKCELPLNSSWFVIRFKAEEKKMPKKYTWCFARWQSDFLKSCKKCTKRNWIITNFAYETPQKNSKSSNVLSSSDTDFSLCSHCFSVSFLKSNSRGFQDIWMSALKINEKPILVLFAWKPKEIL